MNAENYDEVSERSVYLHSSCTEDDKSCEKVVIMRYLVNHEPQMVEITNSAHKIIVGKVKLANFVLNSTC